MNATLLGQSPPYTYPTPYFIFNFLIISFIFIENKCFSDVIWNLKREFFFAERRIRTCVKMSTTYVLPSAPLKLKISNHLF